MLWIGVELNRSRICRLARRVHPPQLTANPNPKPTSHRAQVLTAAPLPPLEADFFELLRAFFPALYDIKYLMKFCDNLHGGLNRLAETLDVARIGPQHQAGSDSLLTSATFLRLAATAFKGVEGMEAHRGVLYGLGSDGANELISAGD